MMIIIAVNPLPVKHRRDDSMQSTHSYPISELARVTSATHEIVKVHSSLRCPAVWAGQPDQCTCNVRFALKRLPKGGKRQ